jgi:hypothetical protein
MSKERRLMLWRNNGEGDLSGCFSTSASLLRALMGPSSFRGTRPRERVSSLNSRRL